MLQAHTEEEFQAWVSAIQLGVTRAYREAEKRQTESSVSLQHNHTCFSLLFVCGKKSRSL